MNKTISGVNQNYDGTYTVYYSDGTTEIANEFLMPPNPLFPPMLPVNIQGPGHLGPPPAVPISPPINFIDIKIAIDPKICSACNEATEWDDIVVQYNPSNIPELNREICRFCHTKAMDKFYGVDRNADNEKTLYGK